MLTAIEQRETWHKRKSCAPKRSWLAIENGNILKYYAKLLGRAYAVLFSLAVIHV